MALTLVPKGEGENVKVHIKYENTPTVYIISAEFTGAVTATLHAKAEMESNFTDVNIKVSLGNKVMGTRRILYNFRQ